MREPRVGAQGGDEGLLKAVVGIDPADRAAQHAEHFARVTVEQNLEWRKRGAHVPIKRPGAARA